VADFPHFLSNKEYMSNNIGTSNKPHPFLVISSLKMPTVREDGSVGAFTLTPGTVLPAGCVFEEVVGAKPATDTEPAVEGIKKYYMNVQEGPDETMKSKAEVEPSELDGYTMPLAPLCGYLKYMFDAYLKEHFYTAGASRGGKALLRELGTLAKTAEGESRDALAVESALATIVEALVARAGDVLAKVAEKKALTDGGAGESNAVMDAVPSEAHVVMDPMLLPANAEEVAS
jgi:hypothetical protein